MIERSIESVKSRRDFLIAGAAATLLPSTTIGHSALAAPAPILAPSNSFRLKPVRREDSDLHDFGDGFANLYAATKASSTFGDQPVFGGLLGTFYALIDEDMIPLFAYAGYRFNQARVVEPGPGEPVRRLDVRGKEAFLYLDLETGQRLERWKNPWTGETVEVYPWLEEGYCAPSTAERPVTMFSMDAFTAYRYGGLAEKHGGTDKAVAYGMPWRRVGDQYMTSTHSHTKLRNPVTPAGWPKSSSGEFVTQHEHLKMFIDAKVLEDPNREHAPWTGSLTRKMPWLPFMRMGQSGVAGGLLALAHCYKITGRIDDVPPPLRRFLEKEHPAQLEPMTSWEHVQSRMSSTLGYYAATVAPETAGYKP